MKSCDPGGIAETEADHFMRCPGCREWFDMRDLSQVTEQVHDGSEIGGSEAAEDEGEISLVVNKISWAQVGRVAAPGRYMFTFGWLTIIADDLAIWETYPNAVFTLYGMATAAESRDEAEEKAGEEFRLGTFDLQSDSNHSESEQ
jgi:hypothetical protein